MLPSRLGRRRRLLKSNRYGDEYTGGPISADVPGDRHQEDTPVLRQPRGHDGSVSDPNSLGTRSYRQFTG